MSRTDEPGGPNDLLDLPLTGDSEEVGSEPLLRASPEVAPPPSAGRVRRRRGSPPRSGRRRGGWLWLMLLLAFPIGAILGYLLSSDPPVAVLSTDLVDFGEARLTGSTNERTVRLSNQGEKALWVSGIAVVGEAADDFRIVADECAGLELATQAECGLRLAFRPTARGARRAQVRFDGNAANGAQTVSLLGVGVQAELAIEPPVLDLGRQIVGDPGASGDLQLANRGSAALRLGLVELSGRHGADFLRVADSCSSQRLDPGERCSVRFTFVPRQAGERRATVRFPSDGGDEPKTADLVAFASPRQPLLRFEPDVLDFGALRVGETSDRRSLRVTNAGNVGLEIRRLELEHTSTGAAPGFFEVVEESCSGRAIPPRGECAIEIRFQPGEEASTRSFLAIDSSAAEAASRVLLKGAGTAPRLRIEPERLSFGAVAQRSVSPIRELRLINSGSAALSVGEITLQGSDAGSFDVAGCSGGVIGPGEVCVVSVRFRPRRAGPHRADLMIGHDAFGKRRQLAVNGLGVAPRLTPRPERLMFGEVRVGSTAQRQLVIENSGRASSRIVRLRLTGSRSAGFDLATDQCSDATLRPGASCSLSVRFRPASAGARSIRLVIETSAAGPSVEVPIGGVATAP
ncbi:MAG: choice-of-anchor D domain-containing protein [Acidobacteriota bacterium]